MEIHVKLFGPMSRAAGARQVAVTIDAAQATCAALRQKLAESQPALAPMLPACRFAVNHQLAAEHQSVGPGDEVALVGLVSGG